MRLFSSEIGQNYTSYTFGYANYCEREAADMLTLIYQSGYLPYSGSNDCAGIFYMARSARIATQQFELSSENRRIAKKFDGIFTVHEIPLSQFDTSGVKGLFLQYFRERHGNVMPEERLDTIIHSGLPLRVTTYEKDSRLAAAVLEVIEGNMGHFWFSAFDLAYMKESLGLWIMIDRLRAAKAIGLATYYLGTVYGEKALYKTNFNALTWWDGTGWNEDVKHLKDLGRTDNERTLDLEDFWKESQLRFTQ